jgi:hypothetical protein
MFFFLSVKLKIAIFVVPLLLQGVVKFVQFGGGGVHFFGGGGEVHVHADIVAETRERANCFLSFFILGGSLGKLPTPGRLA